MTRCNCIAITTQLQCMKNAIPGGTLCAQHLKKCTKLVNKKSTEKLEQNIVYETNHKKEDKSPKKEDKSPKNDISPKKEDTNPTKKDKSPTREDKSPTKKDNDIQNTLLCSNTNNHIESPLIITTLDEISVKNKYGKEGKILGKGAYGTVTVIGDKYALKKMDNRGFEGVISSSIKEIATFVYLGSFPNIVRIYNANITPFHNTVNLLMELADYGSLVSFYSSENMPKINTPEFKSIAYQFVRGVAYMNMLDVVHRDIKPDNVLIFKCDSSIKYIVKIADLGLAKSQTCNLSLDLTNPVYTLWYRSPEILLGSTQYTDKSDSWALATSMFEMATKYPLFPGESELDELLKIASTLGPPSEQDFSTVKYKQEYFTMFMNELDKKKLEGREKEKGKDTDTDINIKTTKAGNNNIQSLLYKASKNERKKDELVDLVSLSEFKSLIENGLVYNPNKRSSSATLLHHPYFNSIRDIIENDKNLKCLKSPVVIQDLLCKQKKCLIRKKYSIPLSHNTNLINIQTINEITKTYTELGEKSYMTKTGYMAFFIYFSYLSLELRVIESSHLVYAASYFIASKLNDFSIVSVDQLTNYLSVNRKDLLKTENRILTLLGWDLYVSTSYDFLIEYLNAFDNDTINYKFKEQVHYLAPRYLMASVALGFEYYPDLIALACIRKALIDLEITGNDKFFTDNAELEQPLLFLKINIDNLQKMFLADDMD